MNERFVELIKVLKDRRLIVTQQELALILDIDTTYLSRLKSGDRNLSESLISLLVKKFPQINSTWLLTGEGSMLKEEENKAVALEETTKENGIPLIPVEAIAGIPKGSGDFYEYDFQYYNLKMIFKYAKFLIAVSGDSMTPNYMSGDFIACREAVPISDFSFQYGKVYLLDCKENGSLLKIVQKGSTKETIKAISINPNYAPFEIPKEDINNIFMIEGVIRKV